MLEFAPICICLVISLLVSFFFIALDQVIDHFRKRWHGHEIPFILNTNLPDILVTLLLFFLALLSPSIAFAMELDPYPSPLPPAPEPEMTNSSPSSSLPSIESRGLSWIEEAGYTPPRPRNNEVSGPEATSGPEKASGSGAAAASDALARANDCWQGYPDERLLRSVDRKLTRIQVAKEKLAEKTVEQAAAWDLGLPGNPDEQKKDISLILENHLDDLDLEKRGRQVKRWVEKELTDSESSFWELILEEIRHP